MGDCLSFGLCHFCAGVAAGWWVIVCHLGRVTLVYCGCRLVGDGLSFGSCHFCGNVAAGCRVPVCHFGCVTCVTFVVLWLPVGG